MLCLGRRSVALYHGCLEESCVGNEGILGGDDTDSVKGRKERRKGTWARSGAASKVSNGSTTEHISSENGWHPGISPIRCCPSSLQKPTRTRHKAAGIEQRQIRRRGAVLQSIVASKVSRASTLAVLVLRLSASPIVF